MIYYYGTTVTKLAKGKRFQNPAMFLKADPKATHVYIVGHWPRVERAYQKLGIPVTRVTHEAANNVPPRGAPPIPATAYLPTAETREEQDRVDIPTDWQQMPWVDLRRLAASVSDTPIINKLDAKAAIERALARRGIHNV